MGAASRFAILEGKWLQQLLRRATTTDSTTASTARTSTATGGASPGGGGGGGAGRKEEKPAKASAASAAAAAAAEAAEAAEAAAAAALAARRVFSRVPAFVVKDMCDVWIAAIRHLPISSTCLMTVTEATEVARFCITFMRRFDLMRSPMVRVIKEEGRMYKPILVR